ncbi:unnamed protein product [Sphenostylis stenocarpa]|uniref:Uncharacterized protein n=1 Tax=Sphenostylis stenocarpa TaxID=92480 RepID=A0AA86VRS9_9FABA|nr:unnamed protein product [Sphenostylis stenocarpa]
MSQKLKERAKQKKEDIESVKKWRKQMRLLTLMMEKYFRGWYVHSLVGCLTDIGYGWARIQLNESNKKRPRVALGDTSGGKASQAIGKGKKQKKRDIKNSKVGFGGKKGLKKQNTANTTNDYSKFKKRLVSENKRKR